MKIFVIITSHIEKNFVIQFLHNARFLIFIGETISPNLFEGALPFFKS